MQSDNPTAAILVIGDEILSGRTREGNAHHLSQVLNSIGIDARLRTVDRAQYKQRLDQFDFDMISMTLNQTLSPGLEQWQYFHSSQVSVKGSKNYAGIANPVVDHLLANRPQLAEA